MVTEDTIDEFSRKTVTEKECISLLLSGGTLTSAYMADSALIEKYNSANEEYFGIDCILSELEQGLTVEEYHQIKADTWLIPDKYKNIDVKEFVLSKAHTAEEIDRVELEYKLYEERELIDILRCMIFLIEYFRENDIVWGVGRGSSVASYILYLIGVHKINSLRYNLDISEFLKE